MTSTTIYNNVRLPSKSLLLALLLLLLGIATAKSATGSSRGISSAWRFPNKKKSHSILGTLQQQHQQQQHSLLSSSPFTKAQLVSFIPRGGAASAAVLDDDSDEDSDLEEEEEEDYDDDDDEEEEAEFGSQLDGADFDVAEDEFAEDNRVDRILEAWRKTPPFTKWYLNASFFATAVGYCFHKNEFPPIFALEWPCVYKKFQLWRPFTAFLNFGPFGLGYAMTAHFVWTYMSTLERLNHKHPYDFWIMMIFGQLCMVIGYPVLKMSPRFLGHNLSTFLVYIWSRYYEGMEVSMFELFNARAELLPWFFLAQTFLLEGEPPILDFLGIVFGHVYHHCKKVGLLRAPPRLVAWYKGDSPWAKQLRSKYREITAEFEMI